MQISGRVSQASVLAVAAFEGAVLPLNTSLRQPWVCAVLRWALRRGPILWGQVADTGAAVIAL